MNFKVLEEIFIKICLKTVLLVDLEPLTKLPILQNY